MTADEDHPSLANKVSEDVDLRPRVYLEYENRFTECCRVRAWRLCG